MQGTPAIPGLNTLGSGVRLVGALGEVSGWSSQLLQPGGGGRDGTSGMLPSK